jgi:hypothetical protein
MNNLPLAAEPDNVGQPLLEKKSNTKKYIIIAVVVVVLLLIIIIVTVVVIKNTSSNDKQTPNVIETACVARGADLYLGCGYAYGKESVRNAQCGSNEGTIKFIGDGIPNGNPCKLPRAAPLYTGCGYAYADKNARDSQCGNDAGIVNFIGDGL